MTQETFQIAVLAIGFAGLTIWCVQFARDLRRIKAKLAPPAPRKRRSRAKSGAGEVPAQGGEP